MKYVDKMLQNKDSIIIEFCKIIDDKTCKVSYLITTNLHCDYGIVKNQLVHYTGTKKGEYNKLIAYYKKILGFKIRLLRTDNSYGFTRVYYGLQKP